MINGITCYHPPKTIHHDDITTDRIADQIAERAFISQSVQRTDEWTIRIPVPFLPRMPATAVRLPNLAVRVNGEPVTIPGGDFTLREATENFSFSGDGPDVEMEAETILVVRAKY
jgi:hypothetical protein